MRRTVPPSAEIEAQIDELLAVGVGEDPRQSLSALAKLGARLIIQRAVEDEFDAWLGRARYERRPEYQRGLVNYDSRLRNGYRPRRVQTGEGEIQVDVPQVRDTAEPFVSKLFPCSRKLLRTEPLRAMVIGAFVRGLSMRDIESLCQKAGLGKLSKSTASRICEELKERFEQFKVGSLYDVRLAALFLDAVFLPVRPEGPKEGVLVAWGFTEEGERVLLSVMLGMRSYSKDRSCCPVAHEARVVWRECARKWVLYSDEEWCDRPVVAGVGLGEDDLLDLGDVPLSDDSAGAGGRPQLAVGEGDSSDGCGPLPMRSQLIPLRNLVPAREERFWRRVEPSTGGYAVPGRSHGPMQHQ